MVCRHAHMPIKYHQGPTLDQVNLVIAMLQDENKLPLLMHCTDGKERTGTIATCYIAAYGFSVSRSERMKPLIYFQPLWMQWNGSDRGRYRGMSLWEVSQHGV